MHTVTRQPDYVAYGSMDCMLCGEREVITLGVRCASTDGRRMNKETEQTTVPLHDAPVSLVLRQMLTEKRAVRKNNDLFQTCLRQALEPVHTTRCCFLRTGYCLLLAVCNRGDTVRGWKPVHRGGGLIVQKRDASKPSSTSPA